MTKAWPGSREAFKPSEKGLWPDLAFSGCGWKNMASYGKRMRPV